MDGHGPGLAEELDWEEGVAVAVCGCEREIIKGSRKEAVKAVSGVLMKGDTCGPEVASSNFGHREGHGFNIISTFFYRSRFILYIYLHVLSFAFYQHHPHLHHLYIRYCLLSTFKFYLHVQTQMSCML